jgi:hypothetical protein
LGALASPTTPIKEIEDDESQIDAVVAVPDSDAVFGVLEASVLIVSKPPGRTPIEEEGGVRVIEIVQLERAGSVPLGLGHVPPVTA